MLTTLRQYVRSGPYTLRHKTEACIMRKEVLVVMMTFGFIIIF